MSRADLLAELLGDEPHELAAALEGWLASRRFAAFVRENLTKVRKKLRGAQDEASARDLLLELTTAYGLTRDKRLSVVYEPTPAGSSRGPDFAVRFTTRQEVMLEVTRLRGPEPETLDPRRLAGVLALKLGQTVPDRANVLLIGVEGEPPTAEELAALMDEVRRDAETTDPAALLKRGFRHRGEYLRRLAAVSALVVRRAPRLDDPAAAEAPVTAWQNDAARTALKPEVLRALVTALGGGPRQR